MTEEEELAKDVLIKGKNFMDRAETPFMLGFGVLLNIVRDKKITTRDVDLMCLVEDLDLESENDAKVMLSRYCMGDFLHFNLKYDEDVGLLDIFPLHKMGNVRYTNMEKKRHLFWPSYLFDKPDTLKFFGETWRIPHDVEKYFEIYYGKDWETPKDWCWETDAQNIIVNEGADLSEVFLNYYKEERKKLTTKPKRVNIQSPD